MNLSNLLVKDLQRDTLVYAGEFSIGYRGRFWRVDIKDLDQLAIKNADVRINKAEGSGESNLQFILDFFSRGGIEQDSSVSIQDDTVKDIRFYLADISVINTNFRFYNPNKEKNELGVDFTNIDIVGLNVEARNMKFEKDTFHVQVKQVSLYEQSGFMVDSLSCDFKLSPTLLQAHNLNVLTPLNDLDLDFSFNFNDWSYFKDFINKVNIRTTIRPSVINLTEVGYFAPVMFNMYNRLRVSADIRGTVSNFKAKELKVGIGKTTQFRGKIQMNGLPNIRETYSHVTIYDFISTVEDARSFRLPTEEVLIDLPEMLAEFGVVRIKGKFTGFYNDFVSYADFKTSIGNFNTDISLRVNENNNIAYDGQLDANNFHAGKFFNVEENIQRLDLSARIIGSGTNFDNLKVNMDGMIDSLEFFDNVYNEIDITGGVENKKFSGDMKVRDDNLSLDFSGSLDYGQSIPSYDFTAILKDAFLSRINLIDRDPTSNLSTKMKINFMGDNIDNIQGIILIDSTYYSEDGKEYNMENFALSITRDSTKYAFLRLYSDIMDASMEGQYSLYSLPASIKSLMNIYVDTLIADSSVSNYVSLNQDFIFSLNLKEADPLTELFAPDLQVSQGMRLTGGYNERIGNLFFDGQCPELIYNGIQFNNLYADSYIKDDNMNLITGAQEVYYSDTLKSDDMLVHLESRNDTIVFNCSWDDKSPVPFSTADINGQFIFFDKKHYQFSFDKADITFTDTLWTVFPMNNIHIDTSTLRFENLGIRTSSQDIRMHGLVSENPQDTLLFVFNNFKLSNFDVLLQTLNIDMDGLMNGNVQIFDYYNSPFYLSDLHIDSLQFNKERLGEANIQTVWDAKQKAFDINSNIIYHGNIGKDTTLLVKGKYYPDRSHDNFDIKAELHKYKLATLEPFTRSFSSDIQGMAVGEVFLRGSTSAPELTGQINLVRSSMLIDYLKVKYYFADKVTFTNTGIYFKDMVISDSINNRAIANGSITHTNLKDFFLDLNINTGNLASMNTTRSDNDIYYGQIMASGEVRISGPFDNLNMSINARSERGTSIKIPISYGTDIGSSEYIVFVGNEEEDTEDLKKYDVDLGGISLNLGLDVTNDADIQMFMPYNMGNMRAKGNGDIKMDIDPAGNLNMEGVYIIDRGSFFFSLQQIINRTFDIKRGSKVTWTGDPYNAQINMKAVYRVKTTLGEYGPPEDSATRVPVNCIISLSNNLINPEINFSVEFPDLQDDTKRYIYARMDTTDQAEMSRQMISLMVMNSFYQPSGFSGSVGFNTFDLVTNQLNNWLSSISNDFDIGVKYRPGDEISTQEVEVALSTQLFDERVLVDGNVGMRGNESTSQNTNNIVGEVNVEVKITKDGRFRAKAFNRSNNNYLVRSYAPYTQGVGVFYTQEFNRLNELFKRRKSKKKIIEEEEAKPLEKDDGSVKK